jgi:DNA (cytosine-5)-methyltransferase 1
MTLTVGSLFSGIGGMDLGLERAGMTVKWQSEIDPFACKVLKKHWPNIANLGDIKTVDWSSVEPVDLIAGGYPCQPFSTAGKRQGENDPRHLWPYFRNAISAIRPKYALLENVPGHLSMGATTVIGDLAEIGYDCQWQLISAASYVGAQHKRERLFIVAYTNSSWRNNANTNRSPPYAQVEQGMKYSSRITQAIALRYPKDIVTFRPHGTNY